MTSNKLVKTGIGYDIHRLLEGSRLIVGGVEINFEKALEELESIVEDLESGDLSLENSLKSFEKGIKLARQCQEKLSKAELQVQKLIEEDGELKTTPLKDV